VSRIGIEVEGARRFCAAVNGECAVGRSFLGLGIRQIVGGVDVHASLNAVFAATNLIVVARLRVHASLARQLTASLAATITGDLKCGFREIIDIIRVHATLEGARAIFPCVHNLVIEGCRIGAAIKPWHAESLVVQVSTGVKVWSVTACTSRVFAISIVLGGAGVEVVGLGVHASNHVWNADSFGRG